MYSSPSTRLASLTLLALLSSCAHAAVSSHPAYAITNSTFVNLARQTIYDSQRAAWEQGTAAQAILEIDNPTYSVFSKSWPGKGPRPDDVIRMGYRAVVNQDSIGRLAASVTGEEKPADGSSFDSASSGFAVLMGASFNGSIPNGKSQPGFLMDGAAKELNFLLTGVPRSDSGLISHRVSTKQAWADAYYMGPPFLAYYGLVTKNQSLLQEAYDQVRLYRDVLRYTTGTGAGLYGHIYDLDINAWSDPGVWVTGNGWAVGGMLRVLASIAHSPFSDQMAGQKNDILNWIKEILDAAYPLLDPKTKLWHNFMNQTETFFDASGSMMLAAATFRLETLRPGFLNSTYITSAEAIRKRTTAALSPYGDFGSGLQVVGVLSFSTPGRTSVESLSFGLLLEASRHDYGIGRPLVDLGNCDGTAVPADDATNTIPITPQPQVAPAAEGAVSGVLTGLSNVVGKVAPQLSASGDDQPPVGF